jgi:hypothetical protein
MLPSLRVTTSTQRFRFGGCTSVTFTSFRSPADEIEQNVAVFCSFLMDNFNGFGPRRSLPINHLLRENRRTAGRIGEDGLAPVSKAATPASTRSSCTAKNRKSGSIFPRSGRKTQKAVETISPSKHAGICAIRLNAGLTVAKTVSPSRTIFRARLGALPDRMEGAPRTRNSSREIAETST